MGSLGGGQNLVFTDNSTGYLFFVDSDSDFKYYKTTDGGQTWSGPTTILTATSVPAFSIWFEKWTPGDSGTNILLWYIDTLGDDILFNALDTADDTLSGEVTVVNLASATSNCVMSGSKSRGGNLLVTFDIDGGTEHGCYRSTDGGVNWTSRADPNEGTKDWFKLFPGNESDTQDMWLIFADVSALEVSLKTYDDSADSWAETSIVGSVQLSDNAQPQFSGVIRHSDNHLILTVWNDRDINTADLLCWDINGSGSITAKTNVNTNTDDCQTCALFIDQNNTDLYCAYLGKSDGSETIGTSVGVYYKKSTDDATTWGAETTMAATATLNLSGLIGAFGATTGRFLVVWYDSSNADLITNYDNSVAISSGGGPATAIKDIIGGGFILFPR